MVAAQFAVVERLSQHPDGSQRHPRLLEQYGYRVRMAERYGHETEALAGDRKEPSTSCSQPSRRGARRS
jgi:CPA1 family monovalent cation:H+ antiporter